ncbi:hypothetical protein [Bacillus altitudinis]|nr:hypothetical protein [Bacillus altitudinis]
MVFLYSLKVWMDWGDDAVDGWLGEWIGLGYDVCVFYGIGEMDLKEMLVG